MSFGKILVLLLGLAAVAFAVRTALTGTAGRDTAAHSAPRRQLDNVRERAKELEREQQKAVDDVAHRLDDQ
jgi:DNA-binding GntR family transcriptional regulator